MDDIKEIIIHKFKSKRNNVYLIRDDNKLLIQKKYSSKANFKTEEECLINLRKEYINVPKIIRTEKKKIYLEYLDGNNLCDIFEEMEEKKNIEVNTVIKLLVDYLLNIYKSEYFRQNNYIMNDVNLRNFILHDKKIYGIDYEEVVNGDIEQDIVGILVFMLTNNPILTIWKNNIGKSFYTQINKNINLNIKKMLKYTDYWLDKLENRRDYDFTKEQKQIIRKIII